MEDMNNSGSRELGALEAMNSSKLWMIWTFLCRKPKALVTMNNSGLWMT